MKKICSSWYLLIALIVLSVTTSCNRSKEPTIEKVLINYSNGRPFCEGSYKHYESGRRKQTGIWNEYFPSGQIASITEYDNKGNPNSVKEFREDGSILLSAMYSDEKDIETYYFDNGKIRSEYLTSYIKGSDEDGNYKYSKSIETEYYKGGKVRSKKNYRNDDLDGETIMWDEEGQIILNCKYRKGIILPDSIEVTTDK